MEEIQLRRVPRKWRGTVQSRMRHILIFHPIGAQYIRRRPISHNESQWNLVKTRRLSRSWAVPSVAPAFFGLSFRRGPPLWTKPTTPTGWCGRPVTPAEKPLRCTSLSDGRVRSSTRLLRNRSLLQITRLAPVHVGRRPSTRRRGRMAATITRELRLASRATRERSRLPSNRDTRRLRFAHTLAQLR